MLLLAHVSVTGAIASAIAPLARVGDTYPALLLIVFVQTLFWLAGIHGSVMLTAVATPVYLTLQKQNTEAFLHHHSLPNIVVVSFFIFIFPGGAGATLPLAILMAFSRVPRLRNIGRVTLLPALLNTNEPLLFGIPVVFNPYLAVPFMIVPLILATTTYVAVASGMVARAAYYLPAVIPTVISAYAATLDPRAVLLVLVNIVIAGIVYFPFVRAYERHVEAAA
jgi:PTS system cellobiose-specific IIC component